MNNAQHALWYDTNDQDPTELFRGACLQEMMEPLPGVFDSEVFQLEKPAETPLQHLIFIGFLSGLCTGCVLMGAPLVGLLTGMVLGS